MREEVIHKLNEVNKKFYDSVGPFFDNSRQYAWDGWETLLKEVGRNQIDRVLDIGCGNGRFETFLAKEITKDFQYLGIDTNKYLLSKFRPVNQNSEVQNADILGEWKLTNKYNLIVSFGVMHHIPSFEKRVEFVKKCANLLAPQGTLCLSFWNFLDDERIAKKQADWSEIGMTADDVEENDYLLTWDRGTRAVRYCHYHTDEEINALVTASGLKEIGRYKAEGKSGKLNTYVILKL